MSLRSGYRAPAPEMRYICVKKAAKNVKIFLLPEYQNVNSDFKFISL
jgi:hypothetical protein